ncbi:ADAM 17-like protease [Hydractinia symbiolongicarpus]|uniref:ADAM 17-like protease n=1 Tax=Hydractinia symbiolongicarpus TaxID=13093 RepID=UPI00254DA05F|nr:ADAM 17-like protease [Hydractinia symbiolongicarpus]
MIWLIYLHLFSHAFVVDSNDSEALTQILRYYEGLKKDDLKHNIIRRDINNHHERHLSFQSHGRTFRLKLFPHSEIFSPSFESVAIDKYGKQTIVHIDRNSHYKGYLKDHEYSNSVVHIDDGMVTATINTDNDTFVIEPMWRHDDKNSFHDMIIYKVSDIYWNLTHKEHNFKMHHLRNHEEDNRVKRSAEDFIKNMCSIILIGDHVFFKEVGRGRETVAIHYMISILARVNLIYQQTDWPGIEIKIGFKVAKTIVHTNYSETGYNKDISWNGNDLLNTLIVANWSKYCLAHLFTHHQFDKGVVGMAKIGSVCSSHGNCAISTDTFYGRRLLNTEVVLVVAHEIGHNLGADHDPDSCSSDPKDKYIMCPTVGTDDANKLKFSANSIKQIANTLRQKKRLCFTAESDQYCGNFFLEKGEQCDAGYKEDSCCTKDCRLKKNAVCSDSNHACCLDCQYAPKTTICQKEFRLECSGETKCNGSSMHCPLATKLNNEEQCGVSKGNCINGTCMSLCVQNGTRSCPCPHQHDACRVCCKNSENNCVPLLRYGRKMNENDGVSCLVEKENPGQCVNGTCVKTQQNVEDEFQDLLHSFTFSKFKRFLQANIVGTVLVFSLILWIPASCIVHYLDKKQDRLDKEMMSWSYPFNPYLMKETSKSSKNKAYHNLNKLRLRSHYHISS